MIPAIKRKFYECIPNPITLGERVFFVVAVIVVLAELAFTAIKKVYHCFVPEKTFRASKNVLPLFVEPVKKWEGRSNMSYLTHLQLVGGRNGKIDEVQFKLLEEHAETLKHLEIYKWNADCPLFPRIKHLDRLKTLTIEFCPTFNDRIPEELVALESLTIRSCRSYDQPLPNSLISLESIDVPPACIQKSDDLLLAIYLKDRGRGLSLASKLHIEEKKFIQLMFASENPEENQLIQECLQGVSPHLFWDRLTLKGIPETLHHLTVDDPLQRLYIYKIFAKIELDSKVQKDLLQQFFEWVIMVPMDIDLQILYQALDRTEIDKIVTVIKLVGSDLEVEKAVRFIPYLLSDHPDKKMILSNLINLDKSGLFDLFQIMIPATSDKVSDLALPSLFTGNRTIDSKSCYQKMADLIAENRWNLLSVDLSKDELFELAPYLTFCDVCDIGHELAENPDDIIGELLERTKQLRYLRIICRDFTGSALDRFKNVESLLTLELEDCPELDNPLPERMIHLESLSIRDCPKWNHCLPKGLHNLRHILIQECRGLKQPLQVVLNSIMPRYNSKNRKKLKFTIDLDHISFVDVNLGRYEFFWRDGKVPAHEIYLSVLACIVAVQKLTMKQLNFSEEEMLELAPHLTYLVIDEGNNEFIEKLLTRTQKLRHLCVKDHDSNGSFLSKLKNLDRLKTLEFENCPNLNFPLPNGLSALLKLTFSGCGRYNQPPPMGMDKLEIFGVNDCSSWKPAFLAQYIFPIYHRDKDLALQMSDLLGVATQIGHYVVFYEAADESLCVTSLALLLGNTIVFPEKALKKIASLLRKWSGRTFLKNHLNLFLKNAQLNELIFSIYPVNKSENFSIYNSMKLRHNTLYVTILPKIAFDHPDIVFMKIKKQILGSQVVWFDVKFHGSEGIDGGGLSRQMLTQLIQALLDAIKSKIFNFTRTESGKVIPQAPLKPSQDDLDNFRVLGILLGIAYRRNCPTGEIFSEKWLHCIHSFSEDDLNGKFSDFIKKMDDVSLTTFMEDCTEQDEKLLEGCKTVLLAKEEEVVKEAATTLNMGWGDEKLEQCVEGGDIEEVRKMVRSIWVADFKSYLRVSQAMVRGMRETLSHLEWEEVHSKWETLRWMTVEKFSKHLQGKLSVEWIKKNTKYEPHEKAIEVKSWVDKWLDEHEDNKQVLTNFVHALTGAKAVVHPITFNLTSAVDSVFPHTCAFSVDVPVNIDEEILRAIFDAYGRGEDLAFTRG